MATISKGILGGFSGKVGTVVGVNWRGMDIIRSVPKRSRKRPTDNQMLQQYKFKLVVSFLQPLRSIQSCISKPAGKPVTGKPGNIGNAEYSFGTGERCAGIGIRKNTDYQRRAYRISESENQSGNGSILNLEWEDNSTQGNAKETDLINLICYLETQNALSSLKGLVAM